MDGLRLLCLSAHLGSVRQEPDCKQECVSVSVDSKYHVKDCTMSCPVVRAEPCVAYMNVTNTGAVWF